MAVVAGALEAPMWFAFPPEIHSTLLSTGPGPGPMLAAAEAWRLLAAQYTDTATELESTLAATQTAWEGPTSAQFVAAHQPFIYWLGQTSTVANASATAHETAAAAYVSALAAMPTLAELAANHVVHGVLVATNFFGINTIPIAVNEADYTRMWIQAATTMSAYEAVSEESLTASPPTSPAPQIVNSAAAVPAEVITDPAKLIIQLFANFLGNLANMAMSSLPGPLGSFVAQALDLFIVFVNGPVFKFFTYLTVDPIVYFGPWSPLFSPYLINWLNSLFLNPWFAAPGAAAAPAAAALASDVQMLPAASGFVLAGNGATAAATTSTTTSAGALGTFAAITTASAPATGAPGCYAVGGGPDGEGFGPISKTTVTVRRRSRQYRLEYLDDDDMALPPEPPVAEDITGSDTGAGTLGFAGTFAKSAVTQAKGLVRIGDGEFAGAPQEPMLPATWDGETPRTSKY